MADTLTVDIVDLTVRPLNPVNIAIINEPNPVSGYAATGEQLIKLIQISNYSIKETATGIPVTGKNIYEYFPELNPGGGGGGGGGDSYTKAETNALLEQKEDAVEGYGLSQENFSPEEKQKLSGITDPMLLKGRVDTVADLQNISNPEPGWVYFVGLETDTEFKEYAYTENNDWQFIGYNSLTIDAVLSNSSTNPVQNAAITQGINAVDSRVTTLSGTVNSKADASAVVTNVAFDSTNGKFTETINNTSSDIIVLDTDPTASSKKPVTSGGTNTAINALDSSFIEVTPTEILTMWNYSSYVKTYIDYDDIANCAIISGDPNSQKAYKNRRRCNLADDGTVNAWYGDPGYVEDGSNGQVMVYQPKFYYKVEPVELDGTAIKKCYYYFSDYPVQGFKLHPFFKNEAGKVVDHAFFSAYEGSLYSASLGQILGWDDKLAYDSATTTAADFTTDKLCSVAGVQPISGNTHNLIIENAEKLATNRGAGWHIDNIFSSSANQMMLIVEYASANSQTVIGNGVAFGSDPSTTKNCSSLTGSTSSLGNSSGKASSTTDYTNTAQTADTKLAVSYRGVENPWGNIWKFIPGFNTVYSSRTLRAYIANNYSFKYTNTTGYTDLGFNLPTSSNYVKYFGYSSEFDWTFVPTVVPGTADGVIGDYVYVLTSNGTRIALLGGDWGNGSNAGLFCWNLNNGSSYRTRHISARLCYVPQN